MAQLQLSTQLRKISLCAKFHFIKLAEFNAGVQSGPAAFLYLSSTELESIW